MMMRGALGACRTGKTFTLHRHMRRELVKPAGWRFLDVDLNAEVAKGRALGLHGAPAIRVTLADSAGAAASALQSGARLVVVSPGDNFDDANVPAFVDELAGVALSARGVILVVHEAHVSMPEGKTVPPKLAALLHRFGHFDCGLWYDTQHFARLSKRVEDETQLFLFHGTGSGRDHRRIREFGGDHATELLEAVKACAAKASAGEKGWHIPVDSMNPAPPYRMVRS